MMAPSPYRPIAEPAIGDLVVTRSMRYGWVRCSTHPDLPYKDCVGLTGTEGNWTMPFVGPMRCVNRFHRRTRDTPHGLEFTQFSIHHTSLPLTVWQGNRVKPIKSFLRTAVALWVMFARRSVLLSK